MKLQVSITKNPHWRYRQESEVMRTIDITPCVSLIYHLYQLSQHVLATPKQFSPMEVYQASIIQQIAMTLGISS